MIELLVVIGIIGLLIGILIPVIFKARVQGQITTTKGYISDLSKAIELYKTGLGDYPEDSPFSVETFVYLLTDNANPKATGAPYFDKKDLNVKGSGAALTLRDPWGKDLRYFRAPRLGKPATPGRFYLTVTLLNAALIDPATRAERFKGNKNSFNLWSFGPNETNESCNEVTYADYTGGGIPAAGGTGGDADFGDDIVNWKN